MLNLIENVIENLTTEELAELVAQFTALKELEESDPFEFLNELGGIATGVLKLVADASLLANDEVQKATKESDVNKALGWLAHSRAAALKAIKKETKEKWLEGEITTNRRNAVIEIFEVILGTKKESAKFWLGAAEAVTKEVTGHWIETREETEEFWDGIVTRLLELERQGRTESIVTAAWALRRVQESVVSIIKEELRLAKHRGA